MSLVSWLPFSLFALTAEFVGEHLCMGAGLPQETFLGMDSIFAKVFLLLFLLGLKSFKIHLLILMYNLCLC